MKAPLRAILFLLVIFVHAIPMHANTDCDGYKDTYPNHYCECTNDRVYLSGMDGLKDLHFADSIWFRTGSNTFTQAGMTAYLFSESDVQVDIYQSCRTTKKLYSFLVPKNQTRDMDHQDILDKLEQNGMSGDANMVIYVLFYPTEEGADCRLMCYPYNTGPNSTTDDPLPVLVGMTYVSSHAYDVYELQAEHIPASCALYTTWSEPTNLPCQLQITRGSATGEVVAEHSFTEAESYFVFDNQLLQEVRANGESLYMHYTHDATAAGRIITREMDINYVMTDVNICRGKTWEYNGQVYTSSTVVPYDTIWQSDIEMNIYAYNLVVAAPELQYDTLALRYDQLPYDYRGQTINGFGDYDLLLQAPDECDEHIALHVRHNLTTIHTVVDTTLCEGQIYETATGKRYMQDVTLIDSLWHSSDELRITQTNVRFSEMSVRYDTLGLKKSKLSYRLTNKFGVNATVNAFGDYSYEKTNQYGCKDSLYLHVYHQPDVFRNYEEKILCEGSEYTHNGVVYTSSITLIDSVATDYGDTLTITTTDVLFVIDELQYDTLSLRQPQLPYDYRGNTIPDFGEYDLTFDYGDCDQRLHLTVLHLIDTLYQTLDTTLCQGKMFTYNGKDYTTDIAFLDTAMLNPDTCIITSVSALFTVPELQRDTLALKTIDLPYTYRGQYVIPEGGLNKDYDVLIHLDDICDERYLLHVYHQVDTLKQVIDTLLCQGRIYEYSKELLILSDTFFIDSVLLHPDTFCINSVSVLFAEPDEQIETLYLKTTDLPYTYRGQFVIPEGGLNKDYNVLIHNAGECDERYLLHVLHAVDTLYQTIDTTLCKGKSFEDEGKIYTEDIQLEKSEWLTPDTYQVTTTRVHFAVPEPQLDTLGLKTTDLPYTYRGLQNTITAFGNYDITIYQAGECDERYLLHVYHKPDTLYNRVDSAVCGVSFEYEGKLYDEEKYFVKQLQYNQDTLLIDTLHVYFTTEVTDVFHTITLKSTQLPYNYLLPDDSELKISDFGTYEAEYLNWNTWCDERLHLQVIHDIDTLYQTVDTTLCQGKVFTSGGQDYTTATTIVDTLQRDADTYVITSVSVTFTAPEAIPDTLALKQVALPYLYRGQETITDFGDYDLTIRTSGECDERYLLHVYHDIDTLYMNVDTTLCEGRIFTYKEVEYTQPAILLDSSWLNMDTWQITTIDIAFTTPDMEYDTIVVKTEELLAGYYYEPADTMVYAAGDYFYEILTYNDCTRHLTLTVNEELTSAVDDLPCTDQPRLIMRSGVVYILRGKDCFTILGMKMNNNKITINIE